MTMRKIREILRLRLELKRSHREIANSVGVGRTTVQECLGRAERAGLGWPLPAELTDAELERRLYPPANGIDNRPEPDWAEICRELKKKGVTRQLLWLEYKESYPDGYQYSRFCDRLRDFQKSLDPVMRLDHKAGERLFVDWAGVTADIIDPKTGEVWAAQIFVATLGASNYTFAVAKASQKLRDWIDAHIAALEYFGGVAEAIVPDNTKTGVTKPSYYDPELNRTYADFARHYDTAILPARVLKPRDKAKVEAAVQNVERWVLAPLRHRQFFSLSELNEAIAERLEWLNKRSFQKLDGSRKSLFEQIEKSALQPLPERRYEYAEWKKATVHKDYHVELERHYYSVPYRYIGRKVELRYTHRTVEIFLGGKRIAAHRRNQARGRHSTVLAHMPENHRQYRDWSPERFKRWARRYGPNTEAFVTALLAAGEHPVQGYRRCFGILRLQKLYGSQRLDAACARALAGNLLTYHSDESILKTGLDKAPAKPKQPSLPALEHKNVRGPDYYN